MTRNRTPETIEAEINHTRDRIDHTIDALVQRFTGREMIDHALSSLRGGTGNFASNLSHSVQYNPVAATLTGVGLAWLMLSGPERRVFDEKDAGDSAAGEKLRERSRAVRDRIGNAAQGARGDMSRLRYGTKDRVARVGTSGRAGARRVRDGVSRTWEEQPLIVGAVAIALGAALGASLPATRREDQMMGETRDDVVRRASEAGTEQLEKANAAAEERRKTAEPEQEGSSASSSGTGTGPTAP